MLAAAAWHAERGRGGPARRLLARAADLLAGAPAVPGIEIPARIAARAAAAAGAPSLEAPPVSLS